MSALDLSLPVVLGTGWFDPDVAGAVDASIATYLDAGGRVLDTGRVYGRSEDAIGDWFRAHGDVPGVRLVTKGGHPDLTDWLPRLSRHAVLADARTSADKLGRPVDLYLLHRDDPAAPVEDLADTLRVVVDEGLASEVGVSNWALDRTRALDDALRERGLRLAALSNYAGLAAASGTPELAGVRSLDAATLAWAQAHRIPNLAWSSQSGGYFVGRERSLFDGRENVRRRGVLDRVAAAAGVRSDDLLARWTATRTRSIVPIVASRTPERLARVLSSTRDAAFDPAVEQLIAALDPAGSLSRALLDPDPAW
ncbi:hypothetical protein GCM10009840_06470 [Pseudolysinimonas kribbensis]|uniref:aldo/keto reductase n=1 Tax=Pseudolysinimonas kribbensis TaxID=433641 RepID=UPI0031D73734